MIAQPNLGTIQVRTRRRLLPILTTVSVLVGTQPLIAQEAGPPQDAPGTIRQARESASSLPGSSASRRETERERSRASEPTSNRPGRSGEAESLTAAGSEAGDLKRPDLLGPFLDPLDPGRLHRRIDEILGLDSGEQSNKPEAPEIPEPIFLEFTRPLGALKYESEFNYLILATGRIPASQFLEYEYVFADWRAVKLEIEFSQGKLETLEPGYQRTLGVGPRHNWVHGFQIFPEVFVQEKFVGGTAAYMFNWKPTEESPFSTSLWAGANRTLIQGPDAASLRLSRLLAGRASGLPERVAAAVADRPAGVWRPLAVADFWYTLSPSVAVGIENDFYCSRQFGEYLILPHINWQPTKHIFIQVGAGYYRYGSVDQAVFMTHINLVTPSPRKPRRNFESDRETARDRSSEPAPDTEATSSRGVIGRLFDRVTR